MNLFLSKSRSLDILFLLVFYAKHKSHFFLCKNSSKKIASTSALPVNNSFAGISSLIKTAMSPPNYFQYSGERGAKLGILNWYSRNAASSFVSEISRTTFPVNYLPRRSNLFCKELIFKWPEKMWFKWFLPRLSIFSESLDSSTGVSVWQLQLDKPQNTSINCKQTW